LIFNEALRIDYAILLQDKPEPEEIDVAELIAKVQKPEKKTKKVKAGSSTVESKSKLSGKL